MLPVSKHSEMSESVLVVLAQHRDLDAFHELVRRFQARLTYYVRRLMGRTHEVDDVVQELWIVVHRRLATLQSTEAFRVWLFKIAHDVAVSYLRRVVREPEPMSDEVPFSAAVDSWNEFEAMENAELVHRTLEGLSREHREVLTLRFLEQLELSEIAEIVGCTTGTVKSRLYYAKTALRKQIEGTRYG
jgi:RNA polymerase sigma-70 factor (ECF subfamily)